MDMSNMLTYYDVVKAGAAGYDEGVQRQQTAAEMAAYGDAQQELRYQNRLMHMANDETARAKTVAGMVAETMYGGQQQPAAPAPPQPVQNTLAPRPITTGNTIGAGQMLPGITDPSMAPAAAPPAPDQFMQQRLKLRDLYNNKKISAQEAQGYDLQITAQEDAFKTKQSAEQWDKIKMAVQTGKIDEEKQKQLQTQLEPIARATVPILQEYEKLAAKVGPEKATAAVQPMYEKMIQSISQIPGYEKAAASAPKQFNPSLAYMATDTFKALEQSKLTADKENAKLAEQTRSGSVTPSGKIIFVNKKGEQFVDGQPYHGKAIKPKVGVTGGSGGGGGVGIPSEGKINHALKSGKPNDAVEYAAQYLAFYGKLPPGMGRSKGGDAVREKAFARVSDIAKEAGMTLPELFAAGADVKANVAAMSKQKGKIANMTASEAQAQKNLDRLEGLYGKLGNGIIPIFNSVTNRLKKGLGAPEPGTAEAVAYETMIEYTRVISQQTTGAAPTDSASKATNELIAVLKDNPAMIKQKFEQFRGLMKDSLRSQNDTYTDMQKHLGRGVDAPPAPAAPGQAPSNRSGATPTVMEGKPKPAEHVGKILYGHGAEAGKKWKSDGTRWIEVR
jgi:hypothetical protein